VEEKEGMREDVTSGLWLVRKKGAGIREEELQGDGTIMGLLVECRSYFIDTTRSYSIY
jgi:hypothetical protein